MLSHHARVFKKYYYCFDPIFSWKPLWNSTTLGRKSNSWTGEWGPGARAPSSTSFRGAESSNSRQRAMTRRPPVLLLWRGINSVLNGVHPRSNSIPTGFHNVLVFNLVLLLLYTWEMLWWQKNFFFLFYKTVLNN